ncbi:cytochrome P450 [Aspergillus varians]
MVPVIDSLLLLVAPVGLSTCAVILVAAGAIAYWQYDGRFATINSPGFWDVLHVRAKQRFLRDGGSLLLRALDNGVKVCRVYTHLGWVYLLSADYANQLKNDPRLSVLKYNRLDFQAQIPGFGPYEEGTNDAHILQSYTKTKMTITLGKLGSIISRNTGRALSARLGTGEDWRTIHLQQTASSLIAEVAGCLFYGEKIATDERVVRTILRYAMSSAIAAPKLHLWPKVLQPIAHWFLPSCRRVRADLREACEILMPLIQQKRHTEEASDEAAHGSSTDLFQYLEHRSKNSPRDPAQLAIMLSMAAIHTTSKILTHIVYKICEHPRLIDELRNEIIEVVEVHGWTKASMEKLRLMDSVMKETLRLLPLVQVALRRVVCEDVTIKPGLTIPQGSILMVSVVDSMWDPRNFPNPENFDPYRFLNLADTSPYWARVSPFIATSSETLGFGLGKEACPGRFLANLEIKIVLCHLLTKYDIKLLPGPEIHPKLAGFYISLDPGKILLRKRPDQAVSIPDLYDMDAD